jgi:hypothetical protein
MARLFVWFGNAEFASQGEPERKNSCWQSRGFVMVLMASLASLDLLISSPVNATLHPPFAGGSHQ